MLGRMKVPPFVYGTAWKEDATKSCVLLALEQGFRGIDTANQRKHYYEEGVGSALREAFDRGLVTRDELFLQTKFTYERGQDHRLPYDPRAPIAEQVRQSFESSLVHLGIETLDSLVLHGPSMARGLGAADRQAWAAMEELQREGRVGAIGISNVSSEQLAELLASVAKVPPLFVQNRCYASQGWDAAVRKICREHRIVYQGFSLLTANGRVLAHPDVRATGARLGATPAQVVFRFSVAVGMLPLTGTTSAEHMKEDLAALALELTADEVRLIERAGL
jgi:diketogulonate reductase-like aldo/keto reductase